MHIIVEIIGCKRYNKYIQYIIYIYIRTNDQQICRQSNSLIKNVKNEIYELCENVCNRSRRDRPTKYIYSCSVSLAESIEPNSLRCTSLYITFESSFQIKSFSNVECHAYCR